MALVAVVQNKDGSKSIAGLTQLQKSSFSQRARFAVVVTDRWQRKGIGSQLLQKLINLAKAEGLTLLRAAFLPENDNLKHLFEKTGFRIVNVSPDEPPYAELELLAGSAPQSVYPEV
jgi:acetyltransferase